MMKSPYVNKINKHWNWVINHRNVLCFHMASFIVQSWRHAKLLWSKNSKSSHRDFISRWFDETYQASYTLMSSCGMFSLLKAIRAASQEFSSAFSQKDFWRPIKAVIIARLTSVGTNNVAMGYEYWEENVPFDIFYC